MDKWLKQSSTNIPKTYGEYEQTVMGFPYSLPFKDVLDCLMKGVVIPGIWRTKADLRPSRKMLKPLNSAQKLGRKVG